MTNTGIQTNAFRYLYHIRADAIANVGDFIDKANLGGEESVGSILHHLSGTEVSYHDRYRRLRLIFRKLPIYQGRVQFLHFLNAFETVAAQNDAIGIERVINRRTFTQKLRITDYVKVSGNLFCCSRRGSSTNQRLLPLSNAVHHNHAYPVTRTDGHG